MIHLSSIDVLPGKWGEGFPFSVAALASLARRTIDAEVLFLVGENGSGKSTLLEALAIASSRIAIGDDELERDETLDAVRPLAAALRLGWRRRTGRGFFLRAEDFFAFSKRIRRLRQELADIGAHGERQALLERYDGDLDERSHGESFLGFLGSRIVPGGLYLVDEPEAALSPRSQLALIALLLDAVRNDCQFVIATHSPILLSCPRASIWELADGAIRSRAYAELDHVRFAREFLEEPQRYLRHLS